MYDVVKEWSELAGLVVNSEPTLKVSEENKLLAIELIQEELEELREAIIKNDLLEVIDAINDLRWVVERCAQTFGINEDSFSELIASNYTKFCSTEKEATDTIIAYSKGEHPNKPGTVIKNLSFRAVGNDFFVIKRIDGKLMKSINFIDCDYEKFL